MKVLIITDMEGVSGCVGGGYGKALPQWLSERYGRLMMGEINAAVEGCVQRGCSEVIVGEAHPVDLSGLHPEAKLARGIPWHEVVKLRAYDAALFVGQHARTGLADAVRSHTGSSNSITGFWINGRPAGELAYMGGLLGEKGVPVVFLSGDSAACREAEDLIEGPVKTVAVEESHSVHGALCLPPAKTAPAIIAGIREALPPAKGVKPIRFETPVRFEVELKFSGIADDLCLIPGMERTGPRTVSYTADSYEKAYKGSVACLGLVLAGYDR